HQSASVVIHKVLSQQCEVSCQKGNISLLGSDHHHHQLDRIFPFSSIFDRTHTTFRIGSSSPSASLPVALIQHFNVIVQQHHRQSPIEITLTLVSVSFFPFCWLLPSPMCRSSS